MACAGTCTRLLELRSHDWLGWRLRIVERWARTTWVELRSVFEYSGSAMVKSDSPGLGFDYFRARASDQAPFTLDELATATGWSANSIKTYRSKQWKELLVDEGGGRFRVRREFLRLSRREFLDHITQKRPLFAKYQRTGFGRFVMFEFLIPLTRESELRSALDELFYSDTVEQRLRELNLDQVEEVVARNDGEDGDAYIARVARTADRFGGYSISRVAGRFRADTLRSRQEAFEQLLKGGDYLIDETTAVVRFIIPCECTKHMLSDSLFDVTALGPAKITDEEQLEEEVLMIRRLFFLLFVEAVVRTIKGEDQIWLLERGVEDRLYVWEQVA